VSDQPMFSSAPPPPVEAPYQSTKGASGPRAGFWARFGAAFIDGLVLLIPNIILRAAFSPALAFLLYLVILWTYATLLEGGPRGQTVGKMALGIRVYDFQQGGSIGYGRAFIRQIVKIASTIPIFLGYFWMLWDKEKQCWHDKAANDVVVPVSAYS
jgi:uncharacterized RDD family membrane protein YckC